MKRKGLKKEEMKKEPGTLTCSNEELWGEQDQKDQEDQKEERAGIAPTTIVAH